MITFKLKFLLAIAPKLEKTKLKTEKATAKKKSIVEADDPPYVIRLEKQFSSAHIEYELISGKIKYQIDVLCWQRAAKIYTGEKVKMLKIINRNGLAFVPVCVEHQLQEISTDELVTLQSSVIEFNLYTDKNKLGNAAKGNKTEIIYLKELECDKNDFVEGYSERGPSKSTKTLKTINMEETGAVSVHTLRQKSGMVTSQMVFHENFADKLHEIIDYVADENPTEDKIQFTDFVKPYNPDETKNPKTKNETIDKKGKKEKVEKAPTKVTLQVQGEIFFTEPHLAIFKAENNKCEVSKFFVLTEVESLMTRTQKIFLNPIVIKTQRLNNFPVEIFENTGFTDVFCKYTIPCIAECKTIEKPISQTIVFNQSHIYFTHTLSKIKLLEFLETKRLVVEIYGKKRHPVKEAEPKLFGERKSDTDISKIHTKFQNMCLKQEECINDQDRILAYCSFDLSSLLKNVWDFREKAQLHNIEHKNFQGPSVDDKQHPAEANCDFWINFHMSTNSINLAKIHDFFKHKSASLLKEYVLIENVTTLSLEAYLLAPQAPALVLHQIPNTYKRLFLIALDRKVATNTFALIVQHNQKILCQKLNTDDMLTGWALDNGNNVAIYVEGPSVGYILNFWQVLDNYTAEAAKVFFNTDQAYEKRLYSVCNVWSGFFIVTLKVPLDNILSDYRLYIKGNVPLPCSKVLTKLNLLFHSRTLKKMIQYDLFPTIEELASLDLEYGVPYCWKVPEPGEKSDSIGDSSESVQMEVNFE